MQFSSYLCARFAFVTIALLVGVAAAAHAQSSTAFLRGWQNGTPRDVSGTVTMLYGDDFANRRFEVMHAIRDERTGERFNLHFENGAPTGLRTGSRLRVGGRVNGHELYLPADATFQSTVQTTQLPPSTPVTGDQKTLIIVADFQDVSVTCSIGSIIDIMFTDPNGLSVDAVYRDNSNDCVRFSGTVVGPYAIDVMSTGTCDPLAWAEAAEARAVASGVDVASYPRKVYVLPPNSCPMSGYGSVGGTTTGAWVFSCNTRRVYQHELGHNLGMMHASNPTAEYGDNTDPMGIYFISNVFGFNAPHRHQMGWLDDVLVVDQSGLYQVAPLGLGATAAAGPRALLIRKPDTGEYYYVSYRYPVGYDSYIDGLYFYRTSVHRYRRDATAAYNTYILTGLGDGETFGDSANGITITQVSHDSTYALVRVELGDPCARIAPTLSSTPTAQSGAAGARATYSAWIANNDSSTCPASTFVLSSAVPSGWTTTISPVTLTLAPGMTASAAVTLTSSAAAAANTYAADLDLSDSAVAGHAASWSVTYTVIADTTAPSAPTNLKAVVRQNLKKIELAWAPASDSGGVAGYIVLRNGAAIGVAASTSWIDTEWIAGSTYTYNVLAFDIAGNKSAPSSNATVALSGGGGGKRR